MAFLRNYGSWYSDGNHGGCAYWNLLVHFVTYDSIRERTAGAEWCLLKTFLGLPHNLSIRLTPALDFKAMAGLVMREERQSSS